MADGLSDLYQDLLTGSYDCVDRIVLNAYFRMGHSPGGFHVWWQALTGSDETLDNTHLMRMAGRFSRRIRGYAKAHDIPIIDCAVGERKHDLAEEYLAKTKITQGLFLVLVGRAQAPVWEVTWTKHLERQQPMPYVNHYSFHILDPDWGHITIKISGHPPFPVQVILKGARVRSLPGAPGRNSLYPGRKLFLLISLTPQAWRRSQTPCPNQGLWGG